MGVAVGEGRRKIRLPRRAASPAAALRLDGESIRRDSADLSLGAARPVPSELHAA
jgi:hypothetical protein